MGVAPRRPGPAEGFAAITAITKPTGTSRAAARPDRAASRLASVGLASSSFVAAKGVRGPDIAARQEPTESTCGNSPSERPKHTLSMQEENGRC